MDQKHTCSSCRWWDASSKAWGKCRFSPPVLSETAGAWPETTSDDWCSRHGQVASGFAGRPVLFHPEQMLAALAGAIDGVARAAPLYQIHRMVVTKMPMAKGTVKRLADGMVSSGLLAKVGHNYYVPAPAVAALEVE